MKGQINVSVENIFPLIKKFLYSDHEIFLRELISNATDATLKLKHLCQIGEAKVPYGNPIIEVKVDKEGKKIHILDQGIGMTEEEVEKYINQIAFSGAEEFLNKYKDSAKDTGIIGHFGLGFYSAFMVADKVEILTRSYQEGAQAVRWECDGSPAYSIEPIEKEGHGTEIILHRTTKQNTKKWTTSSITLLRPGPNSLQSLARRIIRRSTTNSIPHSMKILCSAFTWMWIIRSTSLVSSTSLS